MNSCIKHLFIGICLFNVFGTINAQTAKFEWYDERCTYEATFDSTVYSRNQLIDAHELINPLKTRFFGVTVFKPESVQWINLEKSEREFNDWLSETQRLNLPQGEIWSKIRDSIISETRSSFELQNIKSRAILERNYKILNELEMNTKDTELTRYYEALNGDDEQLLDAFESLVKVGKLQQRDLSVLRKPDWRYRAEILVISLGWYNRANQFIVRFKSWGYHTFYNNLFISSQLVECEEP